MKGGRAARAHKKASDFDPVQLAFGTKHEFEHTKDQRRAQQIAMDHLAEDPRYYFKLAELEQGALGNPFGRAKTLKQFENDVDRAFEWGRGAVTTEQFLPTLRYYFRDPSTFTDPAIDKEFWVGSILDRVKSVARQQLLPPVERQRLGFYIDDAITSAIRARSNPVAQYTHAVSGSNAAPVSVPSIHQALLEAMTLSLSNRAAYIHTYKDGREIDRIELRRVGF